MTNHTTTIESAANIRQKVLDLKEKGIITYMEWHGTHSLDYGYGRGVHTIHGKGDTTEARANDIWNTLKSAIHYVEP